MENKNILYQIKSLEKMIIRNLIIEERIDEGELEHLQRSTPTQMQIIEYILEHEKDGAVHQKDLEHILNLRRATVSGVLQTMERNQLIKRVTNSEDTRTKKIILNEKAKEMFSKHKKKIDELEKVVIKGISKQELETFSRVLEIMKQNIQNENNNKLV